MTYAIEILNKEVELLLRCLTDWEEGQYPEAKKDRDKKLADLTGAIKILTNSNN